jgi:uncharacterized protein YbcI
MVCLHALLTARPASVLCDPPRAMPSAPHGGEPFRYSSGLLGTCRAVIRTQFFKPQVAERGRNIVDIRGKTIGELESEISQAMIRFEKEFMGRGPVETRTYLIDDMVLVRLKGVLTPPELKLAETDGERGRYLLKQVRHKLLDHGRPMLEAIVRDVLGVEVYSLHTDISTKSGERVIVFSLSSKPSLGPAEKKHDDQQCRSSNGRHQLTR